VLKKANPAAAEELIRRADAWTARRYALYRKLAE
jgi:hypothetical protein